MTSLGTELFNSTLMAWKQRAYEFQWVCECVYGGIRLDQVWGEDLFYQGHQTVGLINLNGFFPHSSVVVSV